MWTRFAVASEHTGVDGIPVVREGFPRTVRLVPTARLRSPVLLTLVDKDEVVALEEIEGATSGRLNAEERGLPGLAATEMVHGMPHAHFINASFAYRMPGQLSRFNGPDRGAWYAALVVETCIAEVGYHMTKALEDAGDYNTAVDYSEMFASLAGEFVDLRDVPDHPSLASDAATGYPAGNALAALTRRTGKNGIIYPSVRHESGTCIVALWPQVVMSVAQGSVFRLTWSGSPIPTVSRPASEH